MSRHLGLTPPKLIAHGTGNIIRTPDRIIANAPPRRHVAAGFIDRLHSDR
jgi:hypothetical protein